MSGQISTSAPKWTATAAADAAPVVGTADVITVVLKGNYSGTLTFYLTNGTGDNDPLATANA